MLPHARCTPQASSSAGFPAAPVNPTVDHEDTHHGHWLGTPSVLRAPKGAIAAMASSRLSEGNILKQPVSFPPHSFSPVMVESMKAFGSTVMPSLPLPLADSSSQNSGDPHPCIVDAVSREVMPAANEARESMRLYDSLYGETRKRELEAMYALDVNDTTIADDVSNTGPHWGFRWKF